MKMMLDGYEGKGSNTIETTYHIDGGWSYRIRFMTSNGKTVFTSDHGDDEYMEKLEMFETEQEAIEAGVDTYIRMRLMNANSPNMYKPNR